METEAALLLRIAGHWALTIFFSAAAPACGGDKSG
jgi:hypothetical protein